MAKGGGEQKQVRPGGPEAKQDVSTVCSAEFCFFRLIITVLEICTDLFVKCRGPETSTLLHTSAFFPPKKWTSIRVGQIAYSGILMRTSLPVGGAYKLSRCCTHMGPPAATCCPSFLSPSLTLWVKGAVKLNWVAQTRPGTDYENPLRSLHSLLFLPLSTRQTQAITQLDNDINVPASFA